MRRIVLVLLAFTATYWTCRDEPAPNLRVATFNIENFPQSERQVAGAFDEMKRLDAPIIGLQEITDVPRFAKEARARLGRKWKVVAIETGSVLSHHLAVAYDSARVKHVKTRVHDGTRLGSTHKPVLDVELAVHKQRVRVLVLHFKAGGENQPVRTQQHAALRRIVEDVRKSGARVIVLGDFNATGEADREDLARMPLRWLTEGLACTAFRRLQEECPRSRLDHVFATDVAAEVRAAGGCAEAGCDWQDRCPLYATEVSDHCPIVVELQH